MNTPALGDFRRIIVKVGSSLLFDAKAGGIKESWLASLTADLPAPGDRRDNAVRTGRLSRLLGGCCT